MESNTDKNNLVVSVDTSVTIKVSTFYIIQNWKTFRSWVWSKTDIDGQFSDFCKKANPKINALPKVTPPSGP